MASGFSLKDQLFNAGKVGYLAALFEGAAPGFDARGFEAAVMERLPQLELKERIAWIAECLGEALPGPLPDLAPVLLEAMPPPLDPGRRDDDFGDFIFAPLGDLVVARGLEAHPELALDLLAEITQRFSMEWAVRPFLNRWPDLTLSRMAGWAEHAHYHVRRLVSEGTRPRLPWGQGVSLGLSQPLPLLDRLHGDETRFVTRSVANHLNDITKKDPDLAMDRLEAWRSEGRQQPGELDWMTGHALRGLVKAGHPRALAMLGYDGGAEVRCDLRLSPEKVRIGGVLGIECTLHATRRTPVLVDYILWFAKPDGTQRSKVFKLKQAVVPVRQALTLTKSHRMKGDATTFRLFPGAHAIEVQVNGKVRARAGFELLE